MPRILHYIDTAGPGGAETVFVRLVEQFSRGEFESVAMIGAEGWLATQLRALGVPTIVKDGRGSLNLRLLRALSAHVKELDIDLIHAHFLGPAVYGALVGCLRRVPVVATFHGAVDVAPDERFVVAKSRLLRAFATSVAVSASLRDDLARRLRLDRRKFIVVPNGIDTSVFASAEPMGLRASLGLSASTRLVGSLGNVRPAKAYDVGLAVVERVIAKGLDVHWVVAGHARPDDALLAELLLQADALGVRERVHFLGFVDAPERFLSEIDVYLLCSRSEGHPLALTQAMAAGKPSVVTRCGVEKLFDDESLAWFADVGDVNTMAQQVAECIQSSDTARKKAEAAQEFVRSRFDDNAMVRAYSSLYASLLGR